MNAYNDLTTMKDRMELAGVSLGDTHDTAMTQLLVAASREIDKLCNRFFYVRTETRYFRGAGSKIFFPDDILSVTTLKTDEDGDGTFENTLTESTDFELLPFNDFPKTWADILAQGSYGSFASGRLKGVEIVGSFGFGDGKSATPYVDADTDVNDASVTATVTSITVDDGTKFAVGQTILIDSEQMYISGISTHVLTVTRGVNGTTAATHADDSDVYIYQYPEPIEEAVLIQAMRWWKRKDSAFQDTTRLAEQGGVIVYKGLDPDVKLIVTEYKKKRI